MLTTTDHRRDKAGLTYVYPVLSRRAGGISVGINLNTNNACNWSCIYCQVPNLIRGNVPPVNLDQLKHELHDFLADVINGDFYSREGVPEELQSIKDIAISGNGEPTTASDFDQVVSVIESVLREYDMLKAMKCVLITNGSKMNQEPVKKGLKRLSGMNGEVWFKIDSATDDGIAKINRVKISDTSILKNLAISAELCPTLIQTCVFSYKGEPPSKTETQAYQNLLSTIISRKIPIKGVMIYGIERPSMQDEADNLEKVPMEWMNEWVEEMGEIPLEITVTP